MAAPAGNFKDNGSPARQHRWADDILCSLEPLEAGMSMLQILTEKPGWPFEKI